MSYIKNLIILGTIGILSTPLMATPPADPKQLEARKDLVEIVIEINKAKETNTDPVKARALIEKLSERGDILAMYLRLSGLCEGRFGFKKNPAECKIWNEKRIAIGEKGGRATWIRIEGLTIGKDGYDKNPAEARALVESLIKEGGPGHNVAIYYKLAGLLGEKSNFSSNAFEDNPVEAKAFIKSLIEQNSDVIFQLLPTKGSNMGVEKSLTEAKPIIEKAIAEGNKEAFWSKINGLTYGIFGYPKNPAKAKAMIEELIAQGNKRAMSEKAQALTEDMGNYGYAKNPAEAKPLIESLAAQDDYPSILLKAKGLAEGMNGFEKNHEAARTFIDGLVNKNNWWAIDMKVEGLVHGKYGYPKDPEAGYALARKELITHLNGPYSLPGES